MEIKPAAKIAKRVILGKNKPTPLLRFLCWFTIIWDSLIGLYMAGSGVAFMIKGDNFSNNDLLKDFTKEFCFVLAGLHLASLFSAILMYRLKKNGFFLYVIANIALIVVPFFYLNNSSADYIQLTFTLVMIGLFASQFKKLS